MKLLAISLFFIIIVFITTGILYAKPRFYTWLDKYKTSEAVAIRLSTPEGYERAETPPGTFADWLRHIPLKKRRPAVRLYDGRKKRNQKAHFAVVDIDAGTKDLQQCADAVIRLRAEYLNSVGDYEGIHFNFTSGDKASFTEWIEGYRPVVSDENKVSWTKSGVKDSSYQNFRKYLERVFIYAGSFSLKKEMQKVQNVNEMQIGDVFVQGGFPGHAVIVVDMAVKKDSGEKVFLLAQSYMPAQDIHILKNPTDSGLDPWYKLDFGETLHTPEWTFKRGDLRRF